MVASKPPGRRQHGDFARRWLERRAQSIAAATNTGRSALRRSCHPVHPAVLVSAIINARAHRGPPTHRRTSTGLNTHRRAPVRSLPAGTVAGPRRPSVYTPSPPLRAISRRWPAAADATCTPPVMPPARGAPVPEFPTTAVTPVQGGRTSHRCGAATLRAVVRRPAEAAALCSLYAEHGEKPGDKTLCRRLRRKSPLLLSCRPGFGMNWGANLTTNTTQHEVVIPGNVNRWATHRHRRRLHPGDRRPHLGHRQDFGADGVFASIISPAASSPSSASSTLSSIGVSAVWTCGHESPRQRSAGPRRLPTPTTTAKLRSVANNVGGVLATGNVSTAQQTRSATTSSPPADAGLLTAGVAPAAPRRRRRESDWYNRRRHGDDVPRQLGPVILQRNEPPWTS